MGGPTTRQVRFAAALMIDIDPGVGEPCSVLLAVLGYRVERVSFATAAYACIPVLRPLLVIASAKAIAELQLDGMDLRDVTTAVGSQVVVVPADATKSFLCAAIKRAASARA